MWSACAAVCSRNNCLITPKREGQELGGFDVETFPLLVFVSFESKAVESGLIQVAVTPLRTKDVEAKEEQLDYSAPRLTDFGENRWYQNC